MRTLVLDVGYRLINPTKRQLVNLSNIAVLGSNKMYANYTIKDSDTRLNMFIMDHIEFLKFNQHMLDVDYKKTDLNELAKIYRAV